MDPSKSLAKPVQSSVDALVKLCRSGQLAGAEVQARDLLRDFPDDLALNDILAGILAGQGRFEEAIAAYGKAIEIKPDHGEAYFTLGNIFLHLGRPIEAIENYRRVLEITPGLAQAHSNLGAALLGTGRDAEAIESFTTALERAPDLAEAHTNLGIALRNVGKTEEAAGSFQKALELEPGAAETHNNLGAAMEELGRLDEAISSYGAAIRIQPAYAEAHYNLGNALAGSGDHLKATESYRAAIEIKPGFAAAHDGLGTSLKEMDRLEDAAASFKQAVAHKPDFAQAHNNLATVLRKLGKLEESAVSCRTALEHDPRSADGYYNLGAALQLDGQYEAAVAAYQKALEIKPDFPDAHSNIGHALQDLGRFDQALESYNKALAIKSDVSGASYDRKDVLNNRGNLLRGLKRYEEAINDYAELFEADPDYPFNRGALFYARAECCDWTGFERESQALSAGVRAGKPVVRPFAFFAFSDSPADQLRCAEVYVENRCPPSPKPLWTGERYDHDRIRVAYVSADFHTHPMAFLMAGLFEQHDRSRFETTAISFGAHKQGEMRARLENAFDHFFDVEDKDAAAIARLIRDLEIDIAIDRKGYTQNARPEIFAQRPAPAQAAWLAFPGTVGADYMDYILADRHVIPVDQQQYYTEKVIYLPDTYQANDSTRPIAEQTPSRAEVGLPETGFVFCSFNANYKTNPPVFDVWMRLLNQVKGSVLWLLESNAAAARNLRREAEKRGVAPERLVFAPHIDNADHLARHGLADLFLDTLPFNAHTTTSDALWAGLPVLTCLGTTFAGRVAASLLNAVGLPELITNTSEEYEALALKLARDGNALGALKSKLARNRLTHPLFDTDRMRRHVEAAYEAMWQRHQRGQPPAGFTVPSIEG